MVARCGLAAAVVVAAVACGGTGPAMIAEHNFDGASQEDWPVGNSADGSVGYANGAYRILVKTPGQIQYSAVRFDPAVSAVSLEADATELSESDEPDTWGVACLDGERTGYVFTVYRNGDYAISKALDLRDAKVDLVEQGTSDAIHGAGVTNRITATCDGGGGGAGITRLTLAVNGKEVAEAEDREGLDAFDAYGFLVYTRAGGTEVAFDNLLVTEG